MTFSASIGPVAERGSRERWTNLQKSSLLESPFSRLEYVEDLAAESGREPFAAFVSNEQEGDVAGALVLRKSSAGISHVSPPEFTPYSALAARSLPSATDIHTRSSSLDALARILDETFGKTDLMLPPELQDVRPFQWAGWDVSPFYTFRLSLVDVEATRAGWSEGALRTFRRGKERFEVRSSPESAHAIVNLCLAAYERGNRGAPLPADRLEGLVLRQVGRELATCFTLHEDGRDAPEAGVVVLGAGPVSFYWIAGSVPGPGMTVLIGRLMDRLAGQGYEHFDLVGANTPSIAEFKRRLNPTLVPYFRVRHVRGRMLRIFLSLRDVIFR